MDESCPANHKLFPVEVRVGSRALSTGCPNNLVKGINLTMESSCCTQIDSRCINTYNNTQNASITYVYHENCIGKQACTSFAVVQTTTTGPVVYCDQTLYHSTTTLLEMRYQCIEDDQFFTPSHTGPSSKLGLYSVHVTLQDYAVSAISPTTTTVECSVESSECDGRINIIAKDLRLYSRGGQCFQNISINETETGILHTFNCNDNTNFIQNLDFFKSQTNHIILTFTNSHQQPGGYFWIQLSSANSSHTISVNCPPVEEDPKCTQTTEPPTTTTTAGITGTTAPNTAANNGTGQDPEQPSNDDAIVGGVVGVIVFVIIVIVIVVIYMYKCKRKGKKDGQQGGETQSQTASERTVSDVHVLKEPAINKRFQPQLPPTETRIPSEQPNVIKKDKYTSNGHQPCETANPLDRVIVTKKERFPTEIAHTLDKTNERQTDHRPSRLPPIVPTNGTGKDSIRGNLSPLEIAGNSEQTGERERGPLYEEPDEETQTKDQRNKTKKERKKKKKRHLEIRVSPELQYDTTENRSKTEVENQYEMIINEISEEFTSSHAPENAENDGIDAIRKKKKKKKKKKSKTVELVEDSNDIFPEEI